MHFEYFFPTFTRRLESMVDQMEQFERDATTLDAWLQAAINRTQILSSLEEPELQSLGAIKQKMELFLDFRKEVEGKIPLKTQVVTLGKRRLHHFFFFFFIF